MDQKSILITGCSSGIGLASARMMKERGWRVFATARKPEDLKRLRDMEGVEAVELELSDPSSVKACAQHVIEATNGKLFALFNNAAFGQLGAVEDLSSDLLRYQMEVNLFATHELTCLILPHMRQQNAGRIVQCSSVLGFVSASYRGAYCASKYALEALSDAMRLELANTGIRVSLIEPGPIRTNFVATALATLKNTIDMENSAHRDIYKARIEQMEAGGKQTFKLEPESVARKLVHAVESSRPNPRYFVTIPTYSADMARRFLSTRLLDRFLAGS